MEIDLEDRFFSIEISFCFSIFTAKSEICISKFQSKFTNRKHPEPWNALLTSKEEEAWKGALKIARLITPLPAYHGWRGSPAAVEKQAVENWEALAADRPTWHSAVSSDARLAEKKWIQESKNKRAIRKVRTASATSTVPIFPCPTCRRLFKSRAGLSRHLPTHGPWLFCFQYSKSHGHCRIRQTNNYL